MIKQPNKMQREAALRRAIIRVQPEYYSWSECKKERYGTELSEEEDFRIRQFLLESLFSIKVKNENELHAAFDEFSEEQYLCFNSTILLLQGIGDDNFFLNEAVGKSLLDFETLHDYAYNDYLYQEKANKRDFAENKPQPYRGKLWHRWARLIIDNKFYYITLFTAAEHVSDALDSFGYDKINKLIPHEYVEGKNHGKSEKLGTLWDMVIDAKGMEGQLEELRRNYYDYVFERYVYISNYLNKNLPKKVYMIEKTENNDPSRHFIFSDVDAIKSIRFKHFMYDCRNISGDNSEIEGIVDKELERANDYLEKEYDNIVKNFDPKIVRFNKKRKIVLSDTALDDLL